MNDLNSFLTKFNSKYRVIRMKNKTDTNLKQVLINFIYEFDYPGKVFEHRPFN